MNSSVPAEGQTPVYLEFDNNQLVAMLCGGHDEHLARIEKQLGVLLVPKGNRLAISGTPSAKEAARSTITYLYDRLKRGLDVDAGEVDAAMRLSHPQASAQGAYDLKGINSELAIRTRKRLIAPRSPGQTEYLRALRDHVMVFGIGPAGTGKTYLAVAAAVQMMQQGKIERLILSRPAVEAGERLGFLPGDLKEKVDPYLRPLYDALYDMLPAEQVVKRLETGEIEIAPLAFMRGRTLSNSFIILDEAQNTTPMQMKMLLTRLGENSSMVVTGDLSQIDLPRGITSGLKDALQILGDIEEVAVVNFTHRDVVRHPLVSRIVQAYDARDGVQAELDLAQSAAAAAKR